MARNDRIFISFAVPEDESYRNLLVGQARNDNSPFTFTDMSVKQPWDTQGKTKCRSRIKGCDGLIALLSYDTLGADGVRWEIKCAIDEDVPVLGVYVDKNSKPLLPQEMRGQLVIEWSWDGIAGWLRSL